MFDSTPDQANHEQVSEIVRYVDIDFAKKTVKVQESFLGFIQTNKKDAESLANVILKQLEKDRMNILDCRSQCYDNAPVMAGDISGVQQRIIEKKLAMFVNCTNHSLNLAGVHAVNQETAMITFQSLYVFFSWFKSALGTIRKKSSSCC